MFDVSILVHFERAERPASNPSRNPSSVSPRGVLIDIPVIAIRSVLDKVHLHDTEHTDGFIFHDLSDARCGVVVLLINGRSDVELVARSDLRMKRRIVDPNQSKVKWLRISGNSECAIVDEVQHAQSKLPDRFEQKRSRIDRMAGKVSDEYGIGGVNEPLASKPSAFQIDCCNFIDEEKRRTMRNYPLDIVAFDLHVARSSRSSPKWPPISRSYDRLKIFRLQSAPPEVSQSCLEAQCLLIQDRLFGSNADVCESGEPCCGECILVRLRPARHSDNGQR